MKLNKKLKIQNEYSSKTVTYVQKDVEDLAMENIIIKLIFGYTGNLCYPKVLKKELNK